MSLTIVQKDALNLFSDSQPALKSFAQLTGQYVDDIRLGNLIAGDGLANSLRNQQFNWTGKMPAPAVAAATQDIPVFRAPCDGYLTKCELFCFHNTATWTAGTIAAQAYYAVPYTYYSTHSGYAQVPAELLTGMENGGFAELPLGFTVRLLTSGNTYAIAASGKNIVITATTTFANVPSIGDVICIGDNSTDFVGANLVNVGVYKVTAIGTKTVSATKMGRTNPVSISAVVASNADASDFGLSRQQPGTPVFMDDQVGLRFVVPASGGVDISSIYLTVNFTFQPSLGVI